MQLVIGLIILGLGCATTFADTFAEDLDYTNKILFNKISKTWNEDDIRCYCNLPKCITTNYMCRTARSANGGGCFSEIRDFNDQDKLPTRRGCVELLQDDKHAIKCDNGPRKHNEKDTNTDILVLCCQTAMCNEEKDVYKKSHLNVTTHLEDSANAAGQYGSNSHISHDLAYDSATVVSSSSSDGYNDIWFTIATIAVPICGTIIVVALIVLAIRILKTDNIDHPSSKLNGADDNVGGGGCAGRLDGILVMSGSNSCRKIPLDYDQNCTYNITNKYDQQNCSPLLGSGGSVTDNLYYLQQPSLAYASNNTSPSSAQQNNNCNRKNAELAKRNQLKNLEYNLLPQSCNDPNIKLTNTEDGVINNTYSKNLTNLNNLGSTVGGGGSGDGSMKNNYNNNKESKIYMKDVLNPVVANWN